MASCARMHVLVLAHTLATRSAFLASQTSTCVFHDAALECSEKVPNGAWYVTCLYPDTKKHAAIAHNKAGSTEQRLNPDEIGCSAHLLLS